MHIITLIHPLLCAEFHSARSSSDFVKVIFTT